MNFKYSDYKNAVDPKICDEVDKLEKLEEKHHRFYQESLFANHRDKEEKDREINDMFDELVQWVHDTLEIQDNPYIRVIAALKGVKS